MAAENHSPPARSLRRTQCTNLWVVYNCALSKLRGFRLCTRGGMLESFLQETERLTDDDVMLLLKLIFHRQDTQELLKKLLEREKPETP